MDTGTDGGVQNGPNDMPPPPNRPEPLGRVAEGTGYVRRQAPPPAPVQQESSNNTDLDEPLIPLERLKDSKKRPDNSEISKFFKKVAGKFKHVNKKVVVISLGVVLLIVIGILIGSNLQTSQNTKKDPQVAEKKDAEEAKNIAAEIGKTLELPKEEPVLATVSDAEKVKSDVFFAKAYNGDKLLFYRSAKVAVLYRPSTQTVINYSTNASLEGDNEDAPKDKFSVPSSESSELPSENP